MKRPGHIYLTTGIVSYEKAASQSAQAVLFDGSQKTPSTAPGTGQATKSSG
jgi:hypothetical protein